jgi:gas vesicle protein
MARDNADTIVWFLVGAAVGATVALLYAPQSGDRTRRVIGRKVAEGRDAVADSGRDLMDKGRDLYEKGRRVAEDAAEMVERGRRIIEG